MAATARSSPFGRRAGRDVYGDRIPGTLLIGGGIVLVASLILGGGTRGGFLGDVLLQLLALPVLVHALPKVFASRDLGSGTFAALLVAAGVLLVPLIYLVPLPPVLWTRLPGREPIITSFELLGRGLPWMPLSVSPRSTWLGFLSVLPALAIFLCTLQLGFRQRRILSLLVIGFGALSVGLGLLQIAQGPSSPLRFFEITNPSEAVGFFANRNHYAALLYAVLMFAAGWAAVVTARVAAGIGDRAYDSRVILGALASFTLLVMLISAQLMARSRAGLGLTIVALLAVVLITLPGNPQDPAARDASPPGRGWTGRLFGSAIVLSIIFATQFALYRLMERFDSDPLADARLPFARNTIEAARAYMPFGAGIGTFVPVYGPFEKPADVFSAFANRAHNDFLELWLETGVVGLALLFAFAIWFFVRAGAVWRGRLPGSEAIDQLLARAATVVVALLLAHSLVDYPLRTLAIMGVFAFACALMTAPPGQPALSDRQRGAHRRADPAQSPRRLRTDATPPPVASPLQEHREFERWGSDVAWPEEWRRVPGAAPQVTQSEPPPPRETPGKS